MHLSTHWLQHATHWMQAIQHAGWMGWFLFVGLYALACLLFMPASILTLGAGAIYGFWGGVSLVILGNTLGSVLSLLVTRYFLRDWMTRRLKKYPKIEAIQTAVEKEGWRIVFLTRLSPIMPFSLINYALGLTKLSVLEFMLATGLGAIPSTCVYVYLGTLTGNLARLSQEVHRHGPLTWILQGVGVLVAIGISIYITRKATMILNQRFS